VQLFTRLFEHAYLENIGSYNGEKARLWASDKIEILPRKR
jgi:hypothetical protein